MNENQIKFKIYFLKSIDTIFVLTLTGLAIYSALYAENKEYMIVVCLVGLFLVSVLGRAIAKKVALLRVQLDILMRERKTEEQRTIMSTRHTTVRTKKGTSFTANPTNPVNTTTKK